MSKNLDRQMRRICDTFGDEAVRVWVELNLGEAYAAARVHRAPARPNLVLHRAVAPQEVPHERVLMDRSAEPASEEDEEEEETPQSAPAPARPLNRGLISRMWYPPSK